MTVDPVATVLRVFVDADGCWGNPLGVVMESAGWTSQIKQAVAAQLGFSETAYVDDPKRGSISIFTPTEEFDFAGHPLVGAAWLLAQRGWEPTLLRVPAGQVETWREGEWSWVSGECAWGPTIRLVPVESEARLAELDPADATDFHYLWTWIDQRHGLVRARAFCAEVAVPEDEATGSAAIKLTGALGRPLTILQGLGSELRTRIMDDGRIAVGGRVALDGFAHIDWCSLPGASGS